MKRIILVTALLVFVVFTMPIHAGKPTPQPSEVILVNPPESPIPVTITDGVGERGIVSAYIEFTQCPGCPDPTTHLIRNVPTTKQFILTDILVSRDGETLRFEIMEDDDTKFSMHFESGDSPTRLFQFNAGVPFSPGTNINIYSPSTFPSMTLRLMISGYEIDIP